MWTMVLCAMWCSNLYHVRTKQKQRVETVRAYADEHACLQNIHSITSIHRRISNMLGLYCCKNITVLKSLVLWSKFQIRPNEQR